MHIFKYSPRKGTKAAQMREQVDGKIKEERSQKLIVLSDQNEREYNEAYVGKEVEVLCEEKKDGCYQGHTKNYIRVKIKTKENLETEREETLENKIIKVNGIAVEQDHILAETEKCNKTVTNA